MGLDLALVPIRYTHTPSFWLGSTRINLDRDYRLFAQVPGCHDRGPDYERKPVAAAHEFGPFRKLGIYVGDEYDHVKDDAYGTPLTFMLAGDLGNVDDSAASPWNQAAFAFIRALPAKTPVVLWWN